MEWAVFSKWTGLKFLWNFWSPYETPNFAFRRALGSVPWGKFLSLRSRIVGGFASLRFAPHIRLASDLKFFPGDPPLNLDWEVIFCHRIGDNSGPRQEKWAGVLSFDSNMNVSKLVSRYFLNCLKILYQFFFIKFLKRFRSSGEKLAQKRSKKGGEFLQS